MKTKLTLIPYIAWMVIFAVVPLVLASVFAFTSPEGSFTLDNLVYTGKYSFVFLRSIFFGIVSTFLCLLLGYPMAYCISKINFKYQSVFIMLLMIPMWTSFLLRTYAWMTILEYNGLLNRFLSFCGFEKLNMINTSGAVIFGMVYNFLPYMILPIYTVISKMDKKLVEAAQDLGASRFTVFRKIIFPLSIPGIISGVTMVFVPSVSTFIVSKMLGGGSILMIGDLIEMQFLGNSYSPHIGSAISLVLMTIIIICMGIMNRLDSSYEKESMLV